jgi:hypothetical protein
MTSWARVLGPATLPAVIFFMAIASTSRAQAPKGPRGSQRSESGREPQKDQGPPRARRAWKVSPTPILLVRQPAIRKELKLTDQQLSKIREVNDAFNKQRTEMATAIVKAQGGVNNEALMTMIATLRRENEEAINQVLERRQRVRLNQISLQIEGLAALSRPEVAVRINLDPDLAEEVGRIVAEMKESQSRLWEARIEQLRARGPESRPRADTKKAKTRDQEFNAQVDRVGQDTKRIEDVAAQVISRLLTRRQMAAFKRMLGEPFDLSRLEPNGTAGQGELPPAEAPAGLEPVPGATTPQPEGATPAKRTKKTRSGSPPQREESR